MAELKNVLRKFDTQANLEADTTILTKQWCFATDTNQLAVKKTDGSWNYLGVTGYWTESGTQYYPSNSGDDLEFEDKFELGTNTLWRDPVFAIGLNSLHSLYQISGENGLSSNCYYSSTDSKWYNGSLAEYPKKVAISADSIDFEVHSSNTASAEVTWTGPKFIGDADDPYFDKLSSLTYKDGSDTIFVIDNNGMSVNKTRDASGYIFEAEFGTDNYIKIVKIAEDIGAGNQGTEKASLIVKVTVASTEYTRKIPIYDGIPV